MTILENRHLKRYLRSNELIYSHMGGLSFNLTGCPYMKSVSGYPERHQGCMPEVKTIGSSSRRAMSKPAEKLQGQSTLRHGQFDLGFPGSGTVTQCISVF